MLIKQYNYLKSVGINTNSNPSIIEKAVEKFRKLSTTSTMTPVKNDLLKNTAVLPFYPLLTHKLEKNITFLL